MTARDLVKGAMRLIGAVATGETPTAAEIADGMSALGQLLDSWSTESLTVLTRVREEFALAGGQAALTIGPTGTLVTSRPMRIDYAAIKDTNGNEIPLTLFNIQDWAGIVVKNTQSNLPNGIYFEETYPLGTISFYPVPSLAQTLVLYSWKPLSAIANPSSDISFPPGYERALRYNLAIELAPEYGKSTPADVAAIASESKANIKRMNTKPEYLYSDLALVSNGRHFNIFTGE